MQRKEVLFAYNVYASINDLNEMDKNLLLVAREATQNAYAPYSKFHVAATARLDDGTVVSSTNQENASYPVGICAERTLLSTIASMYPHQKIKTIAISFYNHNKDANDKPATPCGMCRQAMLEWEQRQKETFRLILGGQTGEIYIIDDVTSLLPLSFFEDFLK